VFYTVHLVSWALLGRAMGLGLWFDVGVAAAALQVLWHFELIRRRSRDGCFKAFRQNHWLGFALFAGAALDLALR
jgi:4-hydroxybenzoate polyprenyltransferase